MKDSMGYSSHHHWMCLFTYCLILVMTCLWTLLGKHNIDTWLLGMVCHPILAQISPPAFSGITVSMCY